MTQLKGIWGACLATRCLSKDLTWILFGLTTLQLAFLHPYLELIPEERANLFSGLLCALTLGAALISHKDDLDLRSPEVWITLALALLVFLSGLFSLTPGSSSARGFVVLASGIGGFWCARLLLTSPACQRLFLWFSTVVLAGILLVSLVSYFHAGTVYYFLDANPHTLANRILLLWFAPLALLWGRSGRAARVLGALLLVASYLIFYLSDLRSALLIPLILCLLIMVFGALRFRYLVVIFLILAGITVLFFQHLPVWKIGKEYEPAYYRVENYPFSWHIALKHPFLGIGLRAPREEFLSDYEIKYPYVQRQDFVASVIRIRTSENIFLTFMAELGFPFLILYTSSLIVLLIRLIRRVTGPSPAGAIPPLALLLALVGALLHFQVLDGLYHPQISWFFHLLLGLIPSRGSSPPADT